MFITTFFTKMIQHLFTLFLSFFFFMHTTSVHAQRNKFNKDSLKTEQLIREIKELDTKDSISFRKKVIQAEKLIKEHDFKLLKGSLLLRKVVFSYYNYQYDRSESYVDSAYQIFHSLKGIPEQKLWESHALRMKAVFYGIKGNSEKEQQIYLDLIPVYVHYKDSLALKNIYLNLGSIYFSKTQYNKALDYFSKYMQVKKRSKGPNDIAIGALNMAMTYNEMKDIPHMEKYLNMAQSELLTVKDSVSQWAFYYHLRGQNEILKKQYRQAILYNKKGLRFSEKIKDFDNLANNKGGLATAYYELGLYNEAYAWEKEYYDYTRSLGKWHYVGVSLKRLADLQQKLGQPHRAYTYLKEYVQLSDSIKEDEVTKRLHSLEAEFQSAQKENKITQLQYENERKDWKLQKNKALLIACVTLVAILFILAFLLFRNMRNQKRLNLQEKELHQSELSRKDQDYQIQILSSLMKGTENERRRLGRDLHDGLGGLLSGIKLKMNNLFVNTPGNNGNLESELKSDLDNAIDEMRNVSQSLLPDLLHKFGLSEALQYYCSLLSGETHIAFQSFNVQKNSDEERQLMFYRIAQEVINNAVKHAKATEIFVQLQQRNNQFFLTVEDDGTGFEEQIGSEGTGLSNLRHRIDYLGGTLEISSVQSKGTSVYITCPV